MRRIYRIMSIIGFFCCISSIVYGIDIAPRISDLEIVERLIRLEEGQIPIKDSTNLHINAVNKRFDDMNQGFDSIDNSLDDLFYLTLCGFGATGSSLFGLIGLVIWDKQQFKKDIRKEVEVFFLRNEKDIKGNRENIDQIQQDLVLIKKQLKNSQVIPLG